MILELTFIDKFDSDDKLEKRIIDWVNSDEFVSQFNVDFNFVPLKKNGKMVYLKN
ncbi:MAG: hypothetical protein V8R64_12485 [Thomasclavelia sp.]